MRRQSTTVIDEHGVRRVSLKSGGGANPGDRRISAVRMHQALMVRHRTMMNMHKIEEGACEADEGSGSGMALRRKKKGTKTKGKTKLTPEARRARARWKRSRAKLKSKMKKERSLSRKKKKKPGKKKEGVMVEE